MNFLKLKLAGLCDFLKINDLGMHILNKKYKNNYIRVINYHNTTDKEKFEKQIEYFTEIFDNVDYKKFEEFLSGNYIFKDQPGIVITFDDGYKENYDVAAEILDKYGYTGWFFVSPGLLNTNSYMTKDNICSLLTRNHVIGCHTYSHHRMNEFDTDEILTKEIVYSKEKLEQILNSKIEIFCWCGGEEKHYTRKAQMYIEKAGYKYSMLTNSNVLLPHDKKELIQRINIEETWDKSVVKFQISGIMDLKFKKKRIRVNKMLISD